MSTQRALRTGGGSGGSSALPPSMNGAGGHGPSGGGSLDLDPLLAPDFDAASYVYASVADGADALESKLRGLLAHRDTVDKAISAHVGTHADALLDTLKSVTTLKRDALSVRSDVTALDVALARIHRDFRDPYDRLQTSVRRLENVQATADVLRKVGWFLAAKKKLAAQQAGQRDSERDVDARELVKKAQHVGELETLMEAPELRGVAVVEESRAMVATAGKQVRKEAAKALEDAVFQLKQDEVIQLKHNEIASALQAFFHLGELSERVVTVTAWAAKEFGAAAREALSASSVASAAATRAAESKEPVSAVQRSVLRARAEALLERDLYEWALRAWNLWRVLCKRRDPTTHVAFSDLVAKDVFDDFWARAAQALESEIRSASTTKWVREALVDDYARLRRTAHAMLARLRISTTTITTSSSAPAPKGRGGAVGGPKEASVLLQALHPLLGEFLSRTLAKMSDPAQAMFPNLPVQPHPLSSASTGGGAAAASSSSSARMGATSLLSSSSSSASGLASGASGAAQAAGAAANVTLPTPNDMATFASVIQREALAVAHGDTELASAVFKSCVVAVDLFCLRAEAAANVSDEARRFRLVPPDLGFSLSSASSAPITSLARTHAQEHNAALLGLILVLANRLRALTVELDAALADKLEKEREEMAALRASGLAVAMEAPEAAWAEDAGDEEDTFLDLAAAVGADEAAAADPADERAGGGPPLATLRRAASSGPAPSSSPPSSRVATLEPALDRLSRTVDFLLENDIGSERCFRALDDVLALVHDENYLRESDTGRTSPYVVTFGKAVRTLAEEHLAKLPLADPSVAAAAGRLVGRVADSFVRRVALCRPVGKSGTATLKRDVSAVHAAVAAVDVPGPAKPDLRELVGLERLVAAPGVEDVLELVRQGLVRRSVAVHFLFSAAPTSLHSPHTRLDRPVPRYLADWIAARDRGEEDAWALRNVEATLAAAAPDEGVSRVRFRFDLLKAG